MSWLAGTLLTPVGDVPRVTATLGLRDALGALRSRVSSFRMSYRVAPGLYALGLPDADSDVFVTANYKLSVDALRGALSGRSAWLLVLDTGGINVWCAAGKGKFGTYELMKRLRLHRVDELVRHRRVILPQLGAPGVQAHRVRNETGFRVHYGPVDARDLPAYLAAGYRATPAMRQVRFRLPDRLVLTPMELRPALVPLLGALLGFAAFFSFPRLSHLARFGLPLMELSVLAVVSGAFVTPALLPWIPGRAFAWKGWLAGLSLTAGGVAASPALAGAHPVLLAFCLTAFPLASSYLALQFTGSTPFTGMSGVKLELRPALRAYYAGTFASVLLLIAFKLLSWGWP